VFVRALSPFLTEPIAAFDSLLNPLDLFFDQPSNAAQNVGLKLADLVRDVLGKNRE
jgi:hypothetical protein